MFNVRYEVYYNTVLYIFFCSKVSPRHKLIMIVRIRGDLRSPVQVGSDTMTAFNRNDIY
jgi:hypothetical protein